MLQLSHLVTAILSSLITDRPNIKREQDRIQQVNHNSENHAEFGKEETFNVDHVPLAANLLR